MGCVRSLEFLAIQSSSASDEREVVMTTTDGFCDRCGKSCTIRGLKEHLCSACEPASNSRAAVAHLADGAGVKREPAPSNTRSAYAER